MKYIEADRRCYNAFANDDSAFLRNISLCPSVSHLSPAAARYHDSEIRDNDYGVGKVGDDYHEIRDNSDVDHGFYGSWGICGDDVRNTIELSVIMAVTLMMTTVASMITHSKSVTAVTT